MPDDAHGSRPAMPTQRPLAHGGDLARVACASRAYQGPWLDLSTGINPWPYPIEPVPAALWTRLPPSALLAQLQTAAAGCYGAPSADAVVPAPGSQALIQALPHLRAPARIAVLGPTYGEHAPCWAAAGHSVTSVDDPEALHGDWQVAVVTNPNNPDGRRLDPAWLSTLADRLARRGGWLVVDEAFADVAPELSLAGLTTRPGIVVLRSFGKFFGLAGLRLGFALAEPAIAGRLRAALGPWAVSGPALWIGAAALADQDWIAAMRLRLAAASAALDRLLAEAGLRVVGGTSLYRLVDTPAARETAERLRCRGIHPRDFEEQPRWLRFGLLPDVEGAARLRQALHTPRSEPRHD